MSSQENERLQVEEINLGCSDDDTEHTYKVFVKTFLGYGANEALARHRRDLLLSQIKSGVRSETEQGGYLGLDPKMSSMQYWELRKMLCTNCFQRACMQAMLWKSQFKGNKLLVYVVNAIVGD